MAPDDVPSPLDRRLHLPDGRDLGYADYGDPAGRPVILCHGLPGSRLPGTDQPPGPEHAPGLRFLGVDRPGYGLSTFQANRRLIDWPRDVLALADALGIPRFAVVGGSGGGPYALACAHGIPDRLSHVVVVNSSAPYDRPDACRGHGPIRAFAWWAVGRSPMWARLMAWSQRRHFRPGRRRLPRLFVRSLARPDRVALRNPAVQAATSRHIAEAFRQGSRGVALDMVLLARPWGFRLEDIPSTVHLWQGTEDRNVPRECGEYLARTIPRCQARFVEGAGHLLTDTDGGVRAVLLE